MSAAVALNGCSIFRDTLKSSAFTYLLFTEIKSNKISTISNTIAKSDFSLFFNSNQRIAPEINTNTKERKVSENNMSFLSAITASKKPGISLYCCASLNPSNPPNTCARPKPTIIKPAKNNTAFFKASSFSNFADSLEKNSFKPKTAKIGTHNSATTCMDDTALNLLYSGT